MKSKIIFQNLFIFAIFIVICVMVYNRGYYESMEDFCLSGDEFSLPDESGEVIYQCVKKSDPYVFNTDFDLGGFGE